MLAGIRSDSTFPGNSGLTGNFSDFVGRVTINPDFPFKAHYRFRFDKSSFAPRRNEVRANIGPPAFNINADYSFFGDGTGSGEFANREEITTGFKSQISRDWSVRGSTRLDLQSERTLDYGVGIEYRCDCFTAAIDYKRTFTSDRDLRPTDTIFLRLIFKNLGEIGANSNP
jgi:LPS-assembly protein